MLDNKQLLHFVWIKRSKFCRIGVFTWHFSRMGQGNLENKEHLLMFKNSAFINVIQEEKLYAFRREYPDIRCSHLYWFESGRAIFFINFFSIRITAIMHMQVKTTEALLCKTIQLCSQPQALSICYFFYKQMLNSKRNILFIQIQAFPYS